MPEILETPVITSNNSDLSGSPSENKRNITVSTSVEKVDKTKSLEVVWPAYIEEHRNYLGIPDRYVYDEAMSIALSEAEKQKTGFGIILLKLHLVEDYILKEIMQKIKKNLRYTDFIAHYDKERFILIIPNYNDVMPVAEKIGELCKDSVSYGCALYPDNGKTANELFVLAKYTLEQARGDNQNARCVTQGNGEQNHCCNESAHGELNNIISSIVDSQPQVQPNNTFMPAKHNERQQTPFNAQQHMTHPTVGANQPIFNINNRPKGLLCLATSNKGGVGKTTVMISLAEAIARAEVPTCVVDFDFGAPDLATFFKINKGPGIEYLAGKVPRPGYADDVIRKVRDNLYVLPGPMNATFPQFEPGQLKYLLDVLLAKYAVVIGDTSPEFWTKSWCGELFEIADLVYAIVDQSIFSEQETAIYAPRLIGMGVAPEKIRLVLNKFSPRLHNAKIVEEHFCSKIKKHVPTKLLPRVAATIPEDWDAHAIGGYKGQTVGLDDAYSQWHKLAAEVAQMAGFSYDDVIPGKKHKKKEDVFQKLFGKLKKK
ncbi:nucleotide-binding protein [Desulfoscipio gibsoniae]